MPNISVRFPKDHFIFQYPNGVRSTKIREMVDNAISISQYIRPLKEDIAEIKEMLQNIINKAEPVEVCLNEKKGKEERVLDGPKVDLNEFMEI